MIVHSLQHKIDYIPDILNKEGDIIQNLGLDIIYPDDSAVIGTVSGQENNKNLIVGDKILSVNGMIINSWRELVQYIQNNPDTTINLIVDRNNEIIEYSANILNKNGVGFLGVSKMIDNSNFVIVSYNFNDSLSRAMSSTSDYTILTFKMIGRLVTGDANVKNLSGPLSIAQFSGKSLEMGLSYFIPPSNLMLA